MSKVRLGPFSEVQFSQLQEAVANAGGTVDRINDSALLTTYYDEAKKKTITPYPTYSGAPEFIFLEVEKEFLLALKKDLEKMGMPLVETQPLPEGEEYLCPKCKYVATAPGLCPEHGVPLLEFSDWVEARRKLSATAAGRMMRWLLAAAFIAGLIYMARH
jgi:hypothetical protein